VIAGPVAAAATANYVIDVALDPSTHRLEGSERIRWTNTAEVPTDELYFHLYLNAFAGSETTFMREVAESPLRWFSGSAGDRGWTRITSIELGDGLDLLPALEFVRPDDGNPHDFTVARVALPREIRPGEVIELDVEFEARLPWIAARTGHTGDFHLVAQWFPKLGVFEGEAGWNCHQFHATSEFFADFGSYEVTMTIPEGWVLGATGVEMGRVPAANGRQSVTHLAQRVHDFAWCTAPPELMEVVESDFDPGRDVPMAWLERARSLLGMSPADLELPPMQIRLLVPRTQRSLADRMVRAARLSIAWYGLRFGAYPYPWLTVVSPPRGAEAAGGMEYPNFITTGTGNLVAFPPFSRSPGIEAVTVHEFGHQYFQGMLASNESEEAWLDEGVTSYTEVECMTAIASDGVVPEIRMTDFWGGERLALAFPQVPMTAARKPWEHRRRWVYYLASYQKSAVAMKTVEGLIGPEAMARGLRLYVERFAFSHPTGLDLEAVLGEVSGEDLGWFFDQAIRGDQTPDWAVTSVRHREPEAVDGLAWRDGEWREISPEDEISPGDRWLVEVEVARLGEFIGPVDVELTWEDGSSERRRWNSESRWVKWRLGSSQRLVQVVVDPEGVWALESRRADNYWREERARPDHPLWWVRDLLDLAGRMMLRFL
jgi:hypothetical protein